MDSRFKPNANGLAALQKDLERKMVPVNDAMAVIAKSCVGQPAAQIAPKVRAALTNAGITPNDSFVAEQAERISKGTRRLSHRAPDAPSQRVVDTWTPT